MVERRTAARPSRGGSTARGNQEDAPARRSSYSGEEGRRKAQEEAARQEAERERRKNQVYEPFRFWTPVGETRQLIIIDDAPDFFRYEHALKGRRSGRYDNFVPCINEDANCPVCGVTDKPSYFAMYLTVIDLTGYENKDGKWVPWSKKMLVVKPAQQKKITRLHEKHGTLRGMVLDMTRDGDKDAAIGGDIEFVEFAGEDELHGFYETYNDQDGKKIEIIGDEVFDYESIYPDMSDRQLAALVGAEEGSLGNRDRDDRDIGRSSARGSRDDRGSDRGSSRGSDRGSDRGGRPSGRSAPRRDDDGDSRGREEDRGSSRRGSSRDEDAPRRPARGSRREEPEDQQDDQGDDTPPAREERSSGRTTRRAREEPADDGDQDGDDGQERQSERRESRAPRSRGRADTEQADPPFEQEEEEHRPPAGEPADRSSRRQALRNRRGS